MQQEDKRFPQVKWDFKREKTKRWLPTIGCFFHVKVSNHRFGKTNDHPGSVPITMVGAVGMADPSPKEFLRFS